MARQPLEDKEFLYHAHCDNCGSSDANAVYENGQAYCFSCGHFTPPPDDDGDRPTTTTKRKRMSKDLIPLGDPAGWKSRGITEESAKKWGFTRSEYKSEVVRVFNYRDDAGGVVAQKVRPRSKDGMRFLGPSSRKNPLYGRHLWKGGGRKLVITEGEIDAISVSQVQGHKWPVVSVPTGSKGAKEAIEKNIDWIDTFDEVILMFDEDEPGREAVAECAPRLPPGKAFVARLPMNDPNEMLMAGKGQEIIKAIWDAKPYRPDGLVSIDDILEEVKKPIEWGIPWFLDTLTQLTYGRRYGEVYALGAGTGVGKTDWFTQQMNYDITQLGEKVGAVYLEQRPAETAKRVAGKYAGQRFHIPDAGWTVEELENSVEALRNKIIFYDNFGQTDWDIVKGHLRYMAVAHGIRIFYVDHLTAMADTSSEKESLEQIMKEMAGLAEELDIIIHFISHLTTPEGKPHEEGGRVTIRHFKGSRAIGFWSHFMFGLERDQQAEDEEDRQTTTFRVLKDRYTGQATGEVIYLGYDRESGLLFEKPDYVPASQRGDEGPGHRFPPANQPTDDDDDDDDEVPF